MPNTPLASSARENLTTAQEMLATATNWVSENGMKFAAALLGAIAPLTRPPKKPSMRQASPDLCLPCE